MYFGSHTGFSFIEALQPLDLRSVIGPVYFSIHFFVTW